MHGPTDIKYEFARWILLLWSLSMSHCECVHGRVFIFIAFTNEFSCSRWYWCCIAGFYVIVNILGGGGGGEIFFKKKPQKLSKKKKNFFSS